jgi:organic radical activating enzyme
MININDPKVSYIQPVYPAVKRVYWNLGNICPYSCSYCPKEYNSGTVPFHDIDLVLSVLNKLDKCVVTFGGGEPTYHPDFERILVEKPAHIKIGVSSNLARPYAFWERVIDKVLLVMATYHVEFANMERFIPTAELIYIKNKCQGQITIVMIPSRWDECVAAYDTLVAHKLPVSAKPILNTIDATEADSIDIIGDYTKVQLDWITEHNAGDGPKFMGVYSTNGELLEKVSGWGLLSSKQSFRGWLCHTPMQYLCVNKFQEVFDQSCNQRSKLGTLTEGFSIPTKPKICTQNVCWCSSDIIQKKEKVRNV